MHHCNTLWHNVTCYIPWVKWGQSPSTSCHSPRWVPVWYDTNVKDTHVQTCILHKTQNYMSILINDYLFGHEITVNHNNTVANETNTVALATKTSLALTKLEVDFTQTSCLLMHNATDFFPKFWVLWLWSIMYIDHKVHIHYRSVSVLV